MVILHVRKKLLKLLFLMYFCLLGYSLMVADISNKKSISPALGFRTKTQCPVHFFFRLQLSSHQAQWPDLNKSMGSKDRKKGCRDSCRKKIFGILKSMPTFAAKFLFLSSER